MANARMAGHRLNKLTAMQATKLKTPGRHSDGGGLYLFIDSHGRRRWIFMYVQNGKRTELGIGGGRDLSLANARTEATAMRDLLAQGINPKMARQEAVIEIPTFGDWADAYVEMMRSSWRNAKHAAQWTMTLTKYAMPIRKLPVNEITTQNVLDVLKPLWKRTPETAERLRGRVENVLDAAKAKGYRSGENPARWRGHLDQLLPKRQRLSRGHHAALAYEAIPDFMARLRERDAVAGWALEFTILTAARTGEVLGATWDEVDMVKAIWTIPANRMKGGREHKVPLTSCAISVLERARELHSEGFVFRSPGSEKVLSGMAMAMLLRRMQVGVTVHGFRSSFRDWASEMTGFSHEVCEMALAHAISNKVEAAYRRRTLFDKRRALMEEWAFYCRSAQT